MQQCNNAKMQSCNTAALRVTVLCTHLLAHPRLGPLLPQQLLQRHQLVAPRLPHLVFDLCGCKSRQGVFSGWRSAPARRSKPLVLDQECATWAHHSRVRLQQENSAQQCTNPIASLRCLELHLQTRNCTWQRTAARTCSGSSAAGVPSSALYWKQPMRSNLKLVQKSTSSRCCSSVSPAGQRMQGVWQAAG